MGASSAWAMLGVVVAFGCQRPSDENTPQDTAPSGPVVASLPKHAPDQLAPGELVEGPAKALGVPLPRDLEVRASFVDLVYASGAVRVHPLVEFLRVRLTGGTLREGPEAATFEHVHPVAAPDKELLVRIMPEGGAGGGGLRVEFRDTTPGPASVLPDERSRWRQVGLTPDGRLADPTHLD
jgi:hypothetical protein